MRQVWPLALMLCADRIPNKLTHFRKGALTHAGSPDPRNNRICITLRRHALANWCCRSTCWRTSCRQRQFRLLVSLARTMMAQAIRAILFGERHSRHFRGRRSISRPSQGRLSVPCSLRAADDGHRPDHQQPPQISIALLGDAAEPVLSAGGMPLGHQPDPSRKTAPRREGLPVADLGNQCGGADRPMPREASQASLSQRLRRR